MKVLIFSAGCLLTAFLCQLVLFRLIKSERQTRLIMMIFISLFTACCGINLLMQLYGADTFFDFTFVDYIHVTGIFGSTTLTYMILFSAIEETSPSFLILLCIHKAGQHGRTREELVAVINEDLFVRSKLRGLITDKRVSLRDDRLFITPRGESLLKIFMFYRKVLRLPESGG